VVQLLVVHLTDLEAAQDVLVGGIGSTARWGVLIDGLFDVLLLLLVEVIVLEKRLRQLLTVN